jgi:hypothetical protein
VKPAKGQTGSRRKKTRKIRIWIKVVAAYAGKFVGSLEMGAFLSGFPGLPGRVWNDIELLWLDG